MYKVIFCGTPDIGVDILKSLENLEVEIVGVISQPDKVQGRKKVLVPTPVKAYAQSKNYQIFQPTKIGEIFDELAALQADFLVTCAFGQFIPEKILNLFKNAINVHASLLPQYRGGSPIQYAIKDGQTTTGISLMQMVKKMDAGDVYVQESISIDPSDDAGSLFEKMGQLGKIMVEKYLLEIFKNQLAPTKQAEEQVTFAYNLTNEQENINWDQSATEINNFIRALSPKPIAFTYLGEERIKIKRARVLGVDEHFIALRIATRPGMIMNLDKEGIIVQTKSGYLKILELQRAGKTMVSAGTFNFPNSPFHPMAMFCEKPYKTN